MQLYSVFVNIPLMVYAEDIKDAEEIAQQAAIEELHDPLAGDIEIEEYEDGMIPESWSMNSWVYHRGDDEITVREAIRRQEEDSDA